MVLITSCSRFIFFSIFSWKFQIPQTFYLTLFYFLSIQQKWSYEKVILYCSPNRDYDKDCHVSVNSIAWVRIIDTWCLNIIIIIMAVNVQMAAYPVPSICSPAAAATRSPAEASAQTTGQDGWWFLLPSNSPGSHNMQAANRKESGSVLYIILAVHSCSSFLPMLKLVVCSSLPCASKNTR